MPINAALVDESFDPEQLHAMDLAFEHACQTLRLTDTSDVVTEIVAIKIIETARAGECDPGRLYDAVMTWAVRA